MSGGGGVHPGLRVCRGHLAGLPNVPVHQGALWPAQLRPVVCQGPAAHSAVLPQPRCVFTSTCTRAQPHGSLLSSHNQFSSLMHWRLNSQLCTYVGEMAAVDCESVWNLVFGRFPAELFNDHFLAHELLRFLRLNLESLQLRVPQYTHSFPNLLKVKTRRNAFAQILSTALSSTHTCCNWARSSHYTEPFAFSLSVFVVAGVGQPGAGGWLCRPAALPGDNWNCGGAPPHSAGSALSLCHTGPTTQVDLRAQLSKQYANCQWDWFDHNNKCVCCRSVCLPIADPGGRGLLSLDAFRNPSFRGLFLFLLRTEAGSGNNRQLQECFDILGKLLFPFPVHKPKENVV